MNPRAIARPSPVNKTGLCLETSFEAEPAKVKPDSVVAVGVRGFVKDSFQIAVLRSSLNNAPGADVISWGTVSENVMLASFSVLKGDREQNSGLVALGDLDDLASGVLRGDLGVGPVDVAP